MFSKRDLVSSEAGAFADVSCGAGQNRKTLHGRNRLRKENPSTTTPFPQAFTSKSSPSEI